MRIPHNALFTSQAAAAAGSLAVAAPVFAGVDLDNTGKGAMSGKPRPRARFSLAITLTPCTDPHTLPTRNHSPVPPSPPGTRAGYQAGGFDTKAATLKKNFDGGTLRKTPFAGTFSDPMHEGLPRTLETLGGRDVKISGADEDGKKWTVLAKKKNSKTLIADFTPKGGPDSVVVTAQLNGDLSFPDGNVWKKL